MKRALFIVITSILTAILVGCGESSSNGDASIEQTTISRDINITSYFSKTSGAYYDGGVDNLIIEDINSAKSEIYLAMYDFTNKNIKDAIIEAFKRGVKVQVVTDDEKIDYDAYQEFISNGIEVVHDLTSSKLMHNKFLVIDGRILWSGSGNYTVYAFYRNYENFVRVESYSIVDTYKKEFTYLFNHNDEDYDGEKFERVAIFFSPDSDFEEEIIRHINEAQSSIYFLAFAFTNEKIAQALIDAKDRGVTVKGVFDDAQNDFQTYSVYDELLNRGVDVKLSDKKLHSKVFIFDEVTTITGSYNFTVSANDKN